MAIKIKYVDYGVANRIGDTIEINKSLKRYPTLLAYVLEHEKTHKKEFDLMHEFNFKLFMLVQLLWFCITHPKTLADLMPIQKRKKYFIYDKNMIILYSVIFILIILSIIILLSVF